MKKININEKDLRNIKKMHRARCLQLSTSYCEKIKARLLASINSNNQESLSKLNAILPNELKIRDSEEDIAEKLKDLVKKIESFSKCVKEYTNMLFIDNPFDSNMEIRLQYREIFKDKNDDFGILNHSYKNFREYRKTVWCASNYVQKLNLITCPYCGQNYISIIKNKNKRYVLEADLDHYYPKSVYWYLTLNLYNLIPICRTCNSTYKGDNNNHIINPYIEAIEDKITFEFENIDNHLLKNENVIVNIKEKAPNNRNLVNHIKMLELKYRYEFYQNLIKSVILKRHKYNDKYLEQVAKIIKQDKVIIETDIIRQDFLSEDEPFFKFKSDLWKQIS